MADKNDKSAEKAVPKPLAKVPVGDAYNNLSDDKFRWQVMVPNLGGLTMGSKVGAVHLQPGTPIDYHVERGNLLPLSPDEAADAAANEPPVVPQYAVANLQPPKPDVAPAEAHTFEDAAKADDAKKAEDAKAKADADAKAKHDADEKAKQDAAAKAKAEMMGDKK